MHGEVCDQGSDRETQFFGSGGLLSNRREKFKTFGLQEDSPPPQFLPLKEHPDLSIRKNPEEGAWSDYCNDFFQSNRFTARKVKDEKEVSNFDCIESTEYYLSS